MPGPESSERVSMAPRLRGCGAAGPAGSQSLRSEQGRPSLRPERHPGVPPARSSSSVMPSGAELLPRPSAGDASHRAASPAHQPPCELNFCTGLGLAEPGGARRAAGGGGWSRSTPRRGPGDCGSGASALGWPPAGRQAAPFSSGQACKCSPRAPGCGESRPCAPPLLTCCGPCGWELFSPGRGWRAAVAQADRAMVRRGPSQAERGVGNAVPCASSGQRPGPGCFLPDCFLLSARQDFSLGVCVCVNVLFGRVIG